MEKSKPVWDPFVCTASFPGSVLSAIKEIFQAEQN